MPPNSWSRNKHVITASTCSVQNHADKVYSCQYNKGKWNEKMYFYRKCVLLGITVNDLTFFVWTPYVSTHKVHCLRWLWSFTISKHRHIWEKSLYPQFNWYYDPRHQVNYSCSASRMTCLLVSTYTFPTSVRHFDMHYGNNILFKGRITTWEQDTFVAVFTDISLFILKNSCGYSNRSFHTIS